MRLDREACVRSCFYLQMAVDGDPSNFVARNDLGLALTDLADLEVEGQARTVLLEKAEHYFRDSYRIEPCQQRALYNLALLLAKRRDYGAAVKQLSEALLQTNWQSEPSPMRVKDIRYNRACYKCRLGQSGATVYVNEVRADFEAWYKGYEASPSVRKENLKTLENDVKPDGDLVWLQGKDPDLINEALNHLREDLKHLE